VSHPRRTGPWPTPHERLLLEAALLDGDAARAAWQRWRSLADLDALDAGAQRLLPLLYRRLVALGVDDPELGRLKGVYRRSWYENQRLFHRAGAALTVLHGAGIETLVLKGAALSVGHYRDLGARPMEDADVLVPVERAAEAIAVLRDAGWTPESPRPERLIGVRHAEPLSDPDGVSIDLHWHALSQPGGDDALWAASVPARVGGADTRALGAADQLLHVCLHGAAWEAPARSFAQAVSHVRWVADATTVIRSEAVLDWDRLLAAARARRLTATLASMLSYLREGFAPQVPEELVAALAATPTSRFERFAQTAAMRRPSPLRTLVIEADRYRRLRDLGHRRPGSPPPPRSFPAYVRDHRDFERYRDLGRHWLRRLAARRPPRVAARRAR
jgi:hypothetical protein